MLHLLYGSDTYRSRQQLHAIIAEYQSQYGADIYSDPKNAVGVDIHRIDAEEDDASRIKQLADTGSLFAQKKMIVIERVCSSSQGLEDVCAAAGRIKADPDVCMIIWEGPLAKEGEKRFLELRQFADSMEEFKPLAPAGLRKWIMAEALKREVKISAADLEYLASLGEDLWAVVNELEKRRVSPGDGGKYCAPRRAGSIFKFGDLFMASPRRALAELPRILESGLEEFALYSYLVGYCRTLLVIQSYEERGEAVPATHKINPFVVRKGKTLVRNIPARELRMMLQNFFAEDYKIKTGASTPRDSLTRILLARRQTK